MMVASQETLPEGAKVKNGKAQAPYSPKDTELYETVQLLRVEMAELKKSLNARQPFPPPSKTLCKERLYSVSE